MTTKHTAGSDPAKTAPAKDTPAQGATPRTVTRVLARELIHEGALRRPGETVTLSRDDAAVLEPEGYFEPARAGQEA